MTQIQWEVFTQLEEEAVNLDLRVNVEKTNYMLVTNVQRPRIGQNIFLNEFDLEMVREFKYLGAVITDEYRVKKVNYPTSGYLWEVTGTLKKKLFLDFKKMKHQDLEKTPSSEDNKLIKSVFPLETTWQKINGQSQKKMEECYLNRFI